MAFATGKSQQYKITEALVSADRLGGFSALSFDVRTSIIEFNVYESLEKPYLTGTVAVLDDKGLFDAISFTGTEMLRISIASVENTLDPLFTKTFILTGVERSVKSNENAKSSIYLFSFIEPHAFASRMTKISRSFSGSLEDVVVKTIGREFRKDVDVSYMTTENGKTRDSIQTDVSGIIPNLTPMQTIEWMLARATTSTGSPFYVWATIHDDRLRMGNLDVMLVQKPFNSRLPYTYNPSNAALSEDGGDAAQGFIVKEITSKHFANTLKLVDAGSVSANLGNTDLNTGRITNNRFTFRKTLEKLDRENVIDAEFQNVFDPDMRVRDAPFDAHDAMKYHTVTSGRTQGGRKGYHDEDESNLHLKKLEGRAVRNHLFKNQFQAVVAGTAFFIAKASVGDVVRINAVNDNVEIRKGSNEDDLLDKRRSGSFLIHDVRHTFQNTSHTVSMNLVKLVREK